MKLEVENSSKRNQVTPKLLKASFEAKAQVKKKKSEVKRLLRRHPGDNDYRTNGSSQAKVMFREILPPLRSRT